MPVSPPRPKGPPLNALRAFESAARLGGFSAAADELCVTPGAVAQHIKAVEAWAGAELFERRSQGVRLSSLGRMVLKDFEAAFDHLGDAVQALRVAAAPKRIRIAALPSVAQLWLSPQLPDVRSKIPDIEVSVTAMESRPNLQREPFDLSIFFEEAPIDDEHMIIEQDTIFPVCAPALAAKLAEPADLAEYLLLSDSLWANDWDHWLEETGCHGLSIRHGPVFSLYSLAVAEAQNGAGYLIGHKALVERFLEEGSLVEPFSVRHSLNRFLTIEIASPARTNPHVQQIIDTLLRS